VAKSKTQKETAGSERHSERVTQIAGEIARVARAKLGESTEVIWFGSWPQRRALPRSDIDIALSTGAPIAPEELARVQETVEEIPTLYEIDIVDLSSAGAVLRREILEHGKRL